MNLLGRRKGNANCPFLLPKWPTDKLNIKFLPCFNLLGPSFEFIHIPVCPEIFAIEELGFGAREPEAETRRKRH